MAPANLLKQLTAQLITPTNFQPYGQVISASTDGKAYDCTDAQLVLHNGIPRFYIMRLHQRGRKFYTITRHLKCTQCLGSLAGKEWLLAVAPPTSATQPELDQIAAFRIPGDRFIKLEVGTWHAGPYFDHEFIDFYNLELSDTNINDHDTYNFLQHANLEWEIV
ncbi:ureidoglycolate lyase [Gloeocapsopsis dulcis]|uniref:Ureidoglycolate hydrolase n=1 Tax=Gloeocapsopsis dulcis AAB1 = 1H9 TaxID=1433147 RepID=A0A6N8G229_9CHRO|nr:ureidoglycolate lyase [Gloeocapsopsis dulcis]MUL39024.1 Ureidoglycolate hydrolase [Gloeocapsopsis dulcis AAB1 = 1H9]WNN90567.1 ureidoglycolate lyase [Gloeocapsopsis dulcis]